MELNRNTKAGGETSVVYTFPPNHVFKDQHIKVYCYRPTRRYSRDNVALISTTSLSSSDITLWLDEEETEALILVLQDALRLYRGPK